MADIVALLTSTAKSDLELARILKVSCPTIGRWKRGDSSPHPSVHAAIVRALS